MRLTLLLMTLLLITPKAFPWGNLGHETSAQIGWTFLDRPTQNKIIDLLKNENFVDASVWADKARSSIKGWKHTSTYHYEGIADDQGYLDSLKQLPANKKTEGSLIEALFIAEEILRDSNASNLDKANALKFYIHFIADIHQPFHTGRSEDQGGNKVSKKWFGANSNLHQIWDTHLLINSHQDLLGSRPLKEQVQAYADYLETRYKDFKVSPDSLIKYDEWVRESMAPRGDAYRFKDLNEDQYTKKFKEVIDLRVYLAGLRIAYNVDRVLNSEKPGLKDPLTSLRSQIISIVGNFYEFVSLRPRKNK